jgi:hypothetical protein
MHRAKATASQHTHKRCAMSESPRAIGEPCFFDPVEIKSLNHTLSVCVRHALLLRLITVLAWGSAPTALNGGGCE